MAEETNSGSAIPTLEDWQHWTLVMGQAQQMLMEFWAEGLRKDQPFPGLSPSAFDFGGMAADPMKLMSAGAEAWTKGLEAWGKVLGGVMAAPSADEKERKDRRFAAPEWRENPIFDTIRQTYLSGFGPAAWNGRRDRRAGRRDAGKDAVRDAQLRRCDEPVQFRADQPAGSEEDDRDARREFAQGPRQHAQGHCAGPADPDQARRVRGRAQPRNDCRARWSSRPRSTS